ncbi:MAG: outer membrane protein assembly factor BamB family protein [Alphaproteobacteria bacterium]
MKQVLIFALLLLPILVACSGDEDLILEGERETVFLTETDRNRSEKTLAFPEKIASKLNYTQVGRTPQHSTENNALSFPFEEIKSFSIGKGEHYRNPLTAVPLIKDEKLFTMDSTGKITLFDWKEEEIIWEYTEVSNVESNYKSGGLSLKEGRLFATFGTGDIIALDVETGEKLWNKDASAPIYGAGILDEKNFYFQTKTNKIISLKQKTGKESFIVQGIENTCPIMKGNTPSLKGKRLVVGLTNGQILGINTQGEMEWKEKVFMPSTKRVAGLVKDIIAPPEIEGKQIYVSGRGKTTLCLDLKTGEKIWSAPVGSSFSPLVLKNAVVVLGDDSEIVALDKQTGKEIWREKLLEDKDDKRTFSFPMIFNNQITVFDSKKKLLKIDAQTGKVSKKIDLGIVPAVSPVVAQGHLFILTKSGRIYILKQGE